MLANVSHEIRTPITSINGFAEILMESLEGRMGTFAERIYESGQRLMETLDSVLMIFRLKAGLQDLNQAQVRLGQTVEEAAEVIPPEARKKRIDLRVGIEQDVEGTFSPASVRRIAENLLENGVKFTPAGGQVTARIREEAGTAVLEVEDTGVGIDEEALSTTFEPFRQASEGQGREHEGTGLGLAVTKKIIGQMWGSINVETEEGRGSRFTVRLPQAEKASGETR